MKLAYTMLPIIALFASCGPSKPVDETSAKATTSHGVVSDSHRSEEFSAKEHIEISRKSFKAGDYTRSETHAILALKKDVYSKEARRILEDIAMLDPYYRAAHEHTRVGKVNPASGWPPPDKPSEE